MEPSAPVETDYALRRQRILIVGGGAIGQVFGHHLAEAGAEVSYLLKPRYAADAEDGFDIHRYGLVGVRPKRHLKAKIFTDHRQLRAYRVDQVWLCVSSTAIRAEGFLQDLAGSCPDAFWVSFQPGLEDQEFLSWKLPDVKFVHGMVNFVAYQSPLPGEDLWPEGIAYFVPPMSLTQFTGLEPYATTVANLLQKGGLTAGVRPDTLESSRFGSAVLIPFVIALECAGWSFAGLRSNNALLDLITTSIEDSHAALMRQTGKFPGGLAWFQKRWVWKTALAVIPALAAFPAEQFFQHHFSKVRDQSDAMVDALAQMCRDNALLPRALESLAEQWRARRPNLQVDPEYRDPRTGRLQRIATPPPGSEPHDAPAPVYITGAMPSVTGPVPKLAAPIPVDDELDDDVAPAEIAPVPAVEAIELPDEDELGAFELEGRESSEEIAFEEPEVAPRAGLEEITGDADPSVPEQDVVDLIDVELEPLPAPEPDLPKKDAPVLRTMADLDNEPEEEDEAAEGASLPFEMEDEVMSSAPSLAVPAASEVKVDPEEAMAKKREMQPTIREPVRKEVHFQASVPDEKKADLSREDFIQTEFATEDQNESLRDLKSKLRARFGAPKPLSPALKNDDDGEHP